MRNIAIATAAVTGIALAAPADASVFGATLTPLNGSGVSGTARLVLDSAANTLSVHIQASGLEPGAVHPQHIHGVFDASGNPIDSTTPTTAVDADHDGYIELGEGLTTYGPIIIPLTMPPGGMLSDFPVATAAGTIDFTQTYDLTSLATFADGLDIGDLLPLGLREIVLHGMTVPDGVGDGTTGEVDGTNGYLAVLPVASGEISAVPIPAAGLMLASALAGLALFGGGLFGGITGRRRTA